MNTLNNFLPKGHECLRTEKSYWKMSQLKEGDNRMRIVAQPIAGWIDWDDKKPHRFRPESKPKVAFNPEKPVKPFWTCYVWDYAREALFVLEITQSSILRALTAIGTDEDWGDFTKYDIKIHKKGNGKETKYTLTPLPHKPLSEKIEGALEDNPISLEALYEGRDPWTDLESEGPEHTVEMEIGLPEVANRSPLEVLKELLENEGIETGYLESYLKDLSAKKAQPIDQVIEAAISEKFYPKFKVVYTKELASRPAESVA